MVGELRKFNSFNFKDKEQSMNKKLDKDTQQHKEFYENFLKYTTYSTVAVIIIVALMAIFLV